jgi:hypothetical protein
LQAGVLHVNMLVLALVLATAARLTGGVQVLT